MSRYLFKAPSTICVSCIFTFLRLRLFSTFKGIEIDILHIWYLTRHFILLLAILLLFDNSFFAIFTTDLYCTYKYVIILIQFSLLFFRTCYFCHLIFPVVLLWLVPFDIGMLCLRKDVHKRFLINLPEL